MQTSIKLPGIYMHPTAMMMAWICAKTQRTLASLRCITQESDSKYDPATGRKITFKPAATFQNTFNSMQVIVNSQDLTESLTKRSTSRGPSTFDFDESNWGQRQPCRRPPRTNQLATLLVKHIKHFTTEHDATRGGTRTT